MSLTGKIAMITGSTSGIGLGIAEQLAGAGAHIILNGFGDAGEIEKTRARIADTYKVKCDYRNADISDADAVKTLIDGIVKDHGALDILVNNAGIQFVAATEDFPIEQWHKVMNINLSGVFFAIKSALPAMKAKGFGRIINIASAHGLVASKHKIAYVTAKHGVVGMTKVVALETAEQNITCNAICPGWVLTPLVQKQIDDIAAAQKISTKEAETKLLGEKQPNLRFATPAEIGDMVVYLAGNSARNVTGTTLSIDGGWTAQ